MHIFQRRVDGQGDINEAVDPILPLLIEGADDERTTGPLRTGGRGARVGLRTAD